jgi:hypothetical protein
MAMSCDRVVVLQDCVLVITLAVLLRDVASLLLREAAFPKFCRAFHAHLSHHFSNASQGNVTSPLSISSEEVKRGFLHHISCFQQFDAPAKVT